MIKTGGLKVYPMEVESVLLEHPDVLEAVVVGVEDAVRGEMVKAVIVRRQGAFLSVREITNYCKDRLEHHKIPRLIDFVKEIPKDQSGKVMRDILRKPARDPNGVPRP